MSGQEDDIIIQALADGQPAGQQAMTDAKITLPHVDSTDTPAGMDPRITIRKTTSLGNLTITPALSKELLLGHTGDGGGNGTLNFISASSGDDFGAIGITGLTSYPVTLRGIDQTDPGKKNNIYLTIGFDGGPTLVKSNAFSVAAIPVGVRMMSPRAVQGADQSNMTDPNYDIAWGVDYDVQYISDSGVTGDLDKVTIREQIVPQQGATGAAGQVFGNPDTSDFRSASQLAEADLHSAHIGTIQKVINGRLVPLRVGAKTTQAA